MWKVCLYVYMSVHVFMCVYACVCMCGCEYEQIGTDLDWENHW